METSTTLLQGHSDLEKGAYLGAIASLATADRKASEAEIGHIEQLCDAAGLSDQQKQFVIRAATELTGDDLNKCLDVLKNSELRFSLVADLIAFGKSDNNYSPEEEKKVQQMAAYLGVGEKQFSLLDQFTDKAAGTDLPEEEKGIPAFLSSLGLNDKLKNAGINPGNLFRNLIGIAGPMLLAGMLSGGLRRRSGSGGGMMGGGGLGSIIGMLSGGRGIGNAGGLLGRILGRRF